MVDASPAVSLSQQLHVVRGTARSSSHARFQFHRSHQIELYNFLPKDVEKYDLRTTSRRESNMQGHDHSDERLLDGKEEMPFVVVFLGCL